MSLVLDPYDHVSYPGGANPGTHPDSLSVMARLYGLEPAPVERCRVLEIGCNEGNNLLPMAYAIPGSEFVGLDLAAEPIARGQVRVRELGLTNLRLMQGDLMDADASLGSFDYIIAHGVYAWVPEPVRDRLLAVCRELLTPQGVAFISYNALPGGYLRNLAADILLQAKPVNEDDFSRVGVGLQLLHFVTGAQQEGTPVKMLLEATCKRVDEGSLQVLYHDEMAPMQKPVSYTTFVTHAKAHGLQYVSEAVFPPPSDASFKPELTARVAAFAQGDPIAEEQILDLLRMRQYRETLLCRAECEVSREPNVGALLGMRLASVARGLPGNSEGERDYVLPNGARIGSPKGPTTLLMDYVTERTPAAVVVSEVVEVLAGAGVATPDAIRLMMQLVIVKMLTLHTWDAPLSVKAETRPRASAVCRMQAEVGPRVTSLLHGILELSDPVARSFLRLMDGTRDREALATALGAEFPELPREELAAQIETGLRVFRTNAVLLREDFG